MPKYDREGRLVKRTRQMLHGDDRSLKQVAKDSGLPLSWLRKFSSGETPHPGVNRVEYLYEFLGGVELLEVA